MIKMNDTYKILNWLQDVTIDRTYPLEFSVDEIEQIQPQNKVTSTVIPNESIHEQSVICNGLGITEKLIIPTLQKEYSSSDLLELKIKTTTPIDLTKVQLFFSDTPNGASIVFSTESSVESSTNGLFSTLIFDLTNPNTNHSEVKNRKLVNIKSIGFKFNQSINELTILDCLIRNMNYTYSLEKIQDTLKDAEDRLLNKTQHDTLTTLPLHIQNLKYKIAAAFLWIKKWEYEGKVMDDGGKESRNYATRLLKEVDDAILLFLNPPDYTKDDKEYINMSLVGSTKLEY